VSERRVAVREMLPMDAAAVAELTTQLGYAASTTDIRRRYDFINGREDARLFVAQQAGGSVIGWIHVQRTNLLEADPRAEIWGLVVAESARRIGVGRLLIHAAEEWALDRGLKVMALRSNNLRLDAHKFYERLGYEVVKTQTAFRKALSLSHRIV
jgi:GNAT superfamily N-acetyltransferase